MKEIYNYVEYTNLSVEVTKNEIEKMCKDAVEKNVYGVCVNPFYVKMVNGLLEKTQVKTITVVGFPLGQNTTETKIYEAYNAIKNGADEIEIVINTSRLKAGDAEFCIDEINAVKKVCRKRILKVIIEWDLLSFEEIQLACQIIIGSKADFISLGTNQKNKISKDKLKVINEFVKDEKGIKVLSSTSQKEIKELISSNVSRIGVTDSVE